MNPGKQWPEGLAKWAVGWGLFFPRHWVMESLRAAWRSFWWNCPVLCCISVRGPCVLDSGTLLTACPPACLSGGGSDQVTLCLQGWDWAGQVGQSLSVDSVGILFTVDIFALISVFNIVLQYS